MRILTELIGGVVLLLIFAYGVNATIKFISQSREKTNDDVPAESTLPDAPAAGDEPG
jgi:hypothetical protein